MDFRNDATAVVLCRVVDTIKAVFTLRATPGPERDRAIYFQDTATVTKSIPSAVRERSGQRPFLQKATSQLDEEPRTIPEIFFRTNISKILPRFRHI
ncbi:unnamed protein product [Lasius platythorax]|uniref:Uncharacterized protein n=1 Tax=Lasius platythorax TaxID=488582 RepID=A0AAV2NC79_9HYME